MWEVLAKLSGDSVENVTAIAKSNGIQPLVALLQADDPETQSSAAVVLSDMTRTDQEHALEVAKHGGVPFLVHLLSAGQTLDAKSEAAMALSSVAVGHALEVGEAGAIVPLVELLKTASYFAQKAGSIALARISAGGKINQDRVDAAGGIELIVQLSSAQPVPAPESEAQTESCLAQTVALWEVHAAAADALLDPKGFPRHRRTRRPLPLPPQRAPQCAGCGCARGGALWQLRDALMHASLDGRGRRR